jgi:hypothetical protein
MWPGGFSNNITVSFVAVNDIPLAHPLKRRANTLDRQEQAGLCTYESEKGELSISWPSGGEGDNNDNEGAEDNSIEEEKNQKKHRVAMGKPPRKATWN